MSSAVSTLLYGAEGQHVVLVAPPQELAGPSTVRLPAPEPAPGLILPSGDINWSCPCLGGMATGPCGNQFRDAFSCFHHSTGEPKGSECYDKFSVMQQCMQRYPELYGKDDDELSAAMESAGPSDSATPSVTPSGTPSGTPSVTPSAAPDDASVH